MNYNNGNDYRDEQERSNINEKLVLIGICLAIIAVISVILLKNPAKKPDDGNRPAAPTTDSTAPAPETDPPATTPEDTTRPPETTPPETEPPREYNYVTDVSAYLEYIDTDDKSFLVLANRSHALGSDYVPEGLVKLNGYGNVTLRSTAAKAFEAMHAEMVALGMADVVVSSSYRTYDLQYKLYNKYIKEELANHPGYTWEQAAALVDTYSARPGTSDHQTGLTVDFYPVSERFEKTKTFKFMMENGYKFGFILRFPEGKTDITGYMYESWHWRFVGRKAATEIFEKGITLEEYLGMTD